MAFRALSHAFWSQLTAVFGEDASRRLQQLRGRSGVLMCWSDTFESDDSPSVLQRLWFQGVVVTPGVGVGDTVGGAVVTGGGLGATATFAVIVCPRLSVAAPVLRRIFLFRSPQPGSARATAR